MNESLYFIAVLPPEKIQSKIMELKEEIANRFNSKQALKSPAHITLHMPFRWKDKKQELLFDVISEVNNGLEPFDIKLENFGFFEPRVVFVNVVENERLRLLQKEVVNKCRSELNLLNSNYKDQVFRPHMTIAFRDLKKPMFYEAQKHFRTQKFESGFTIDKVTLLKHDGKQWHSSSLTTDPM